MNEVSVPLYMRVRKTAELSVICDAPSSCGIRAVCDYDNVYQRKTSST